MSELKLNKNAIDYRPLFYIELFAGLRMGEICALTPKDIDFINGVIHVRNTVTRGIDYEIKLGNTTKTHKGVRDVPINSCLVPVLKKALSEYRKNDDNLLFYNFKSNIIYNCCFCFRYLTRFSYSDCFGYSDYFD